jgi:flagellar basal body-associated protein FliL
MRSTSITCKRNGNHKRGSGSILFIYLFIYIYIYLFIYCLLVVYLTKLFSNTDYTASNEGVKTELRIGKILEEAGRGLIKVL